MNKIRLTLLLLCIGLYSSLSLVGCSSKPKAPSAGTEANLGDGALENAKTEAEQAEWEAHRLREEIYRLEQSQKAQ